MADHSARRGATALIIGGREDAPELRLHAEHVEKVAAYPKSFGQTHFSALGEVEIVSSPRENTGERFLSIANLFPNRIGYRGIERLPAAANCFRVLEANVDEFA